MADTIAAISTAAAGAGIGIIRVSGPEAVAVCDGLFVGSVSLCDIPANSFRYGRIKDDGRILDEAIILVFHAPHSYTGEDVVEIQCHGGMLVLQRILEALFKKGIRPADPGEFSKRAFLNGRMDLSQAEAVMDVIRSQNDRMLSNAQQQLSGLWGDELRRIRQEMLLDRAYVEASLDDPEHFDLDDFLPAFHSRCEGWMQWLTEKIKSADDGQRMREGIYTAIIGRPNVGKSSLLNVLAGRERAIVTEIAGTTRDLIEETVNVGDVTLRLVDTAGLRDAEDLVEQIGVERSRKTMKEAQLLLFLVDASSVLSDEEQQMLSEADPNRTIVVRNKQDLDSVISEADLAAHFSGEILSISASTGEGLAELRNTIRNKAYSSFALSENDYVVTNPRHLAALVSAKNSLKMVTEGIDAGMPEDVLMIDLTDAYTALGRILGEAIEEELANTIFANFCVGK